MSAPDQAGRSAKSLLLSNLKTVISAKLGNAPYGLVLRVALTAVFSMVEWCSSANPFLEAKGSVDYSFTDTAGKILSARRVEFEVRWNANTYAIKTVEKSPNAAPTLEQTGFDGLDYYHLRKIFPAGSSDSDLIDNGTDFGEVSAGSFPSSHPMFGQLLWLAFASGNGGRAPNAPLPLEIFVVNNLPVSAFTNVWHRQNGTGSVERVEFFAPGFRYTDESRLSTIPLPAPLNKGFKVAEFAVLAFRSFEGNLIPERFEFTHFAPSIAQQIPLERFRFSVTSIGKVQVESVLPPFTMATKVSDYRFADSHNRHIVYWVTNAVWKDRADRNLRTSYRLADGVEQPFSLRVIAVRLLLLGLALAGLVVFWKSRMRRSQTK